MNWSNRWTRPPDLNCVERNLGVAGLNAGSRRHSGFVSVVGKATKALRVREQGGDWIRYVVYLTLFPRSLFQLHWL
jgi:hypothetical protein